MKVRRTSKNLVTTVQNFQIELDVIPAYYEHTPKMTEHLDIALVYLSPLLVIFESRQYPHLQATILRNLVTIQYISPFKHDL
jgi:hypothetical protein